MKLTETTQLIAPLIPHYRAAQEKMVGSDIAIIQEINRHLHSNNGKQFRPLLTLLTACCCGLPQDAEASHPVFTIAAAIDTLHTSTLVHDDVVDEACLRRGIATVNKIWNNKTAVLLGDFYLARVMDAVNSVDNKRVTQIINDTVMQMSEGELLQQQYCGEYAIGECEYYQIITRKTAIFMAACCQTGAILASDDASLANAAYHFGLNLGIAFQIRDDIIDFKPSQLTGKPQGNDLKEHKITLPLIIALRNENARAKVMPLLEKERITDSDVAEITEVLEANGYLRKAKREMIRHLCLAENELSCLPANVYREGLKDIIYFLKEK